MNDNNFREFRKKVLKVNQSRTHKVSGSNGVYDAYKWTRKNKWLNIGEPVTEHDYYAVIRQVNDYLAESLLKGNDITLPCRMGSIELRKYDVRISMRDGKLKTNLPIDWDRTLKLWAEDEDSFKQKMLIKMEEKEIFKVLYNRRKANYENQSFYTFDVNRDIKVKLKQKIKDRAIDAFKL